MNALTYSCLLSIVAVLLHFSCGTTQAKNPPLGTKAAKYAKSHPTKPWHTLGKAPKKLSQEQLDEQCKLLISRLDLTLPGMSKVKDTAQNKNWQAAASAYIELLKREATKYHNGQPSQIKLRSIGNPDKYDMDMAAAALENKFISQRSYGPLEVPADLPWTYNPTNDMEWVWQLNRMYFWLHMAKAYQKTNDQRLVKKWVETMRDWVSEADTNRRELWRTIECGERGRRWPFSYYSFIHSPNIKLEDHVVFLNAYYEHIPFLMPWDRSIHGLRVLNWGLILNDGVMTALEAFPYFKDAQMWTDVAAEVFEQRMKKEVSPDGSHCELTYGYHFGVTNEFTFAKQRLEKLGYTMFPGYWKTAEHMHDYVLFATMPDGQRPMIGHTTFAHVNSLMNNGANLFNRQDMRYIGTRGEKGEKPDYLDAAMPDGGFYIMRSKWIDDQDKDGMYMLMDLTHFWGGGHSNYDAQNIILYGNGRTLLDDTGIHTYVPPDSNIGKSTRQHSTVVVDGKNQNKKGSVLDFFARKKNVSFIDGYQDGYKDVRHRRQVLFVRPDQHSDGYFIVVDRLTGKGTHTLEQYWHLFPIKETLLLDGHQATTQEKDGLGNLMIRALETKNVEMDQVKSFLTYEYVKLIDRPAIRFSSKTKLPATFVTLLKPFKGEAAPKIETSCVIDDKDMVLVEVKVGSVVDTVLVGKEPTKIEGKQLWYAGLMRKVDGKSEEVCVFQDRSEHRMGVKAHGWD
ncbi:alginate lyase family protein [Poriferisphaera sp. WC338]|uniref:alginate lyase family protein n=1 Tax=Poriferisphaera sp. WC338 TaxID=3425129 RepID=UPI003D815B59